jgi:hypothetical protein
MIDDNNYVIQQAISYGYLKIIKLLLKDKRVKFTQKMK